MSLARVEKKKKIIKYILVLKYMCTKTGQMITFDLFHQHQTLNQFSLNHQRKNNEGGDSLDKHTNTHRPTLIQKGFKNVLLLVYGVSIMYIT